MTLTPALRRECWDAFGIELISTSAQRFQHQINQIVLYQKEISCNAHNARDTHGTSIIIENWLYCYTYMKKGFGPNLSTSGVFNRTCTFSPNQYHMFMCTTGTETTDGCSHWMV